MNQSSLCFRRVYVWRKPAETFTPDCLLPTVKHDGSLKVWGAISWRGLGSLDTQYEKVTAAHYVYILGDLLPPFVQTLFPGKFPLCQDDKAHIHTAKIVQKWFEEHEKEIGHIACPSLPLPSVS